MELGKLNSRGIDCYNRNRDMKNIPINHLFVINEIVRRDNRKYIYSVYSYENPHLKDYYHDDCLYAYFIRKPDF